jgi:hypothetical protein
VSDLLPQLAPNEQDSPSAIGNREATNKGLVQNGLAELILTLVELLRQVLERQAVRRFEKNDLSANEVERLGTAFIELKNKIEELTKHFGIKKEELNLNLGSLLKSGNKTLDESSLVDVLDTCIQKGLVLAGKARVSVADVDLIGLDLYAVLHPISRTKSGM